jgi:hypothetical protein
MLRRFGVFFVLLGTTLMVLFVVSDISATPNYIVLLFGFLIFSAGLLIIWRTTVYPGTNERRFRTIRRVAGIFKKSKKEEEE